MKKYIKSQQSTCEDKTAKVLKYKNTENIGKNYRYTESLRHDSVHLSSVYTDYRFCSYTL